ncbi:hypothetical protein CBM2634_P90011 [Cupriavidus taiwanensis]|uniref:Uncharacterized protein n=1 Tax=Cupriavidus taiwanensis TaxID=164546 RepID=A0A375JB10_9BURK|nr:hypothetical protein CBM2634_P90011 [Cupriavidus taiwanensis]
MGQHDNDGFALAAQPGGSQGRPTTNTSSQLNVYERPAHPKFSPVLLSRMVEPYTKLRGEEREGAGSYHAGYECHREYQCAAAQDHQDARSLPQRRGGDQAAVAGPAQHHRQVGGSSTHDWKAAMNQFAILYEERFTHPHR